MPKLRTFIAIESSDEVRRQAARLIERLQRAEANVKWVEAHNIHCTLKFLGDVENTETADICRDVATAVAELAPFETRVSGVGAFPGNQIKQEKNFYFYVYSPHACYHSRFTYVRS